MTRKLTTIPDLLAAGLVRETEAAAVATVAKRYAVAISPRMAALSQTAPDGPIARQFVPDKREAITHPDERIDPIGDGLKSPVPGIVHRYPDRALLKLAAACPVYCRFCFRRAEVGPGQPSQLTGEKLAAALAYIADTPELFEIIITGGDPLVLAPRHLQTVTDALAVIKHVRVVRWHTRVPVVSPEVMTPERIQALQAAGKTTAIALHVNHPDELTPEADAAISALRSEGIMLVSQTVLLRGINDQAEILDELMRALLTRGVLPYYLHHPDLAPGTSHFRLSVQDGQRLVAELRRRLSGLAQPTYVIDIPGAHGKVPIGPVYHEQHETGLTLIDPHGGRHEYPSKDDEGASDEG